MKATKERAARLKHPAAWVVSADMGYGHQRSVFPFKDIVREGIVTVGKNDGSTAKEHKLWKQLLNAYESFSSSRGGPLDQQTNLHDDRRLDAHTRVLYHPGSFAISQR